MAADHQDEPPLTPPANTVIVEKEISRRKNKMGFLYL